MHERNVNIYVLWYLEFEANVLTFPQNLMSLFTCPLRVIA